MNELNNNTLREYVESALEGTDCFPVRTEVQKGNVVVEIDSDTRVDIDFVADLSRKIETYFAPEIDRYDLEVGSVGLTAPLTLPRQYRKNIGNKLEVLGVDGRKYKGVLKNADEEGFALEIEEKVKKEGEKRPVVELVEKHFGYGDVKRAEYMLEF